MQIESSISISRPKKEVVKIEVDMSPEAMVTAIRRNCIHVLQALDEQNNRVIVAAALQQATELGYKDINGY